MSGISLWRTLCFLAAWLIASALVFAIFKRRMLEEALRTGQEPPLLAWLLTVFLCLAGFFAFLALFLSLLFGSSDDNWGP